MDHSRHKVEEKVFSYIEEHKMIKAGDRVVVGVSGGADSVCLLFLLCFYRKKIPFSIYAVHVNHQIRKDGEAGRDEKFTQELTEKLNIPCRVYTYPVEEIAAAEHMTVEEAGRYLRRNAFFQECERQNAGQVALAHHRDDLAETVLHNLARGTGAAGLGGIRPVRRMENIEYIRPLLCIGKQEIVHWLQEHEIPWMEDSTNQEMSYTRNRIRGKILPEMEKINVRASEHIAKTSEHLLIIEDYLQKQSEVLYKKYVKQTKNSMILDGSIEKEHRIMKTYVVKQLLSTLFGEEKDITAIYIEEVLDLLGKRTGRKKDLSHGITAEQSYGSIIFSKKESENAKTGEDGNLKELIMDVFPFENNQIPEKKYTKWFDYDRIEKDLVIRNRKPGDYITINARGGRKKLKDYLIDCKIPKEERDSLTLLADGSHILWVVGYRISEYYKVTGQTKTVIRVQVKGEENERNN